MVLNDSSTQAAHIDAGANAEQAGGGVTVRATADRDAKAEREGDEGRPERDHERPDHERDDAELRVEEEWRPRRAREELPRADLAEELDGGEEQGDDDADGGGEPRLPGALCCE